MQITELKRIIASSLGSLGLFSILDFALDFNTFVALAISGTFYYGLYYITTPSKKIGLNNLDESNFDDDLYNLYLVSKNKILEVQKINLDVQEIENLKKSTEVSATQILKYLENNLEAISSSQHFLSYHFDLFYKIVKNYQNVSSLNFSDKNKEELQKNTKLSLESLDKIFKNQLENYHSNILNDIKDESELLEKTVKMGVYK